MDVTSDAPVEHEDLDAYCRAIETYLCRKNDGHLIRIAGPGFDLVRRWAEQGIPLKVAFSGIDRTFERYYRKGPRRRPVQIAFCEADILDAFDEWCRALGPPASGATVAGAEGEAHAPEERGRHGISLPAHLQRVSERLVLLTGTSGNEAFERALTAALREIDEARGAGRFRGEARRAIIERLAAIEEDLVSQARATLPPDVVESLAREARHELGAFAGRMDPSALAAAQATLHFRLIREAARLPTIRYDG
jgi:hypothetical protein